MFIGFINPPHKQFVDAETENRVRNYIVAIVLITVLPSTYLAYELVTDVAFNSRARDFIKNELAFENTLVTQEKIVPDTREIDVTFIGNEVNSEQIATAQKHMKNYKLENARLVVHQAGDRKIDIASLKTSLLSDFYSTSIKAGEEKDKRIQALENELEHFKAEQPDTQSIARELSTQYPMLLHVALAKTPVWKADGSASESTLVAYLETRRTISAAEQKKIIAWLKVRTKMENVRLLIRRG